MDTKTVVSIANVLVFILVVGIFYLLYRFQKKAMEKPSGRILNESEKKLAETYCKTRDVTFEGLVVAGSALEGKLVLTNQRLLYSTYDEKKVAVVLEPKDIVNISVVKVGILSKQPALAIEYIEPRKKQAKIATFTIKEKVDDSNPLFRKQYVNPESLESFYGLLLEWKKQVS